MSQITTRYYLGTPYEGGFMEIQREDGTSMSGIVRSEVLNEDDVKEAKDAFNDEVYLIHETIVAEKI